MQLKKRDHSTDCEPTVELMVGDWSVAEELNQISRAGRCVRLEPKVVELLVFLARRRGDVVSREELLNALWPGLVVGDNALTQVVAKLRRALGDTAREPSYIEAIAKRGYRLIAAVEHREGRQARPRPDVARRVADPRATSPRRTGTRMLAGLAAATVAAAAWLMLRPADGDMASAPDDSPSARLALRLPTVIIRPIESLGSDEERLMARGLTADLVNDLSKVSGLWVVGGGERVDPVAPESIQGRPRSAGRYALAGTLQAEGRTLRLQMRLSDLESGRQLWTQRFDRRAHDLFAVQDELVRSILDQLPIKVSQAEMAGIARRYTRNVEAYEHFLHGQAAVLTRRQAQNEPAREAFWKAIELDPSFSRAYAGLAMTYALAYQLGWEDDAALGRAVELARTASEMDPDLPEAHWVLGFVQTQRRRHADAIGHLKRAIRLNPSYADAYALMGGIRTYTGRSGEGVALLRTALRLNPDAGSLYFLLLGRALYFVGQHELARVNLEQALARNADNVEAHVYLAAVLAQLGQPEAAAWQAEEIRAIEPEFSAGRWLATYPMTDRRQTERLAQALAQIGL